MADAELTPEQVETLRRGAVASQARVADSDAVVDFIGGPLDGLTIRVGPGDSVFLGFCTVTPTGPVQAIYYGPGVRTFRFDSLGRGLTDPISLGLRDRDRLRLVRTGGHVMVHPDNASFCRFTGPQPLDKGIHALEGHVRGIAANGEINAQEVAMFDVRGGLASTDPPS